MSELLALKSQITYGPVRSRRLGRSLGINLLPPFRKWCTFDCLYCQYGWTPANDETKEDWHLPTVAEVVQAVEKTLSHLDESPAYLTFSGNGEPTLHPDFPKMVTAIVNLRDRLAIPAKTALLSNASLVGNPAIRQVIARLDRPIMKLDAGNEIMFRSFNRPLTSIAFPDIVAGLAQLRATTLQALFAAGPQGNLGEEHVTAWIETVKKIRPHDVQVYSISRPVPCHAISQAAPAELLQICERLLREGIQAETF